MVREPHAHAQRIIARLFTVSTTVAALRERAADEYIGAALDDIVDELDLLIADVRASLFDLVPEAPEDLPPACEPGE